MVKARKRIGWDVKLYVPALTLWVISWLVLVAVGT